MTAKRTSTVRRFARAAMLLFVAAALTLPGAHLAAAGVAQGSLLTPLADERAPLDFTLRDVMTGKPVRLSSLRGKVVIVNFWSTACPACRAEIATIGDFWKKMKGLDVALLTVHVGGNAEKVRAFMRETGAGVPALHDEGENIARAWGVAHIPVTYIVNPDGTLAFVAFGARNWQNPQLLQTIMSLVPSLHGNE